MVLGYPYDFDELVVVDLPPDDRHPLYHSERFGAGDTERGQVRYEYRSMADLSFADDASVDLVYSGQSIEHVTEADGEIVLQEAFRILRPGGYMAIDTPNGRVCRLQQSAFIDPDHKVEYTLDELRHKVKRAGFDVLTERGLNWGGPAVARDEFDPSALAGNYGIYYEADECYLLALVIQKPADRLIRLGGRTAAPRAGEGHGRFEHEDRDGPVGLLLVVGVVGIGGHRPLPPDGLLVPGDLAGDPVGLRSDRPGARRGDRRPGCSTRRDGWGHRPGRPRRRSRRRARPASAVSCGSFPTSPPGWSG